MVLPRRIDGRVRLGNRKQDIQPRGVRARGAGDRPISLALHSGYDRRQSKEKLIGGNPP
jgi:hypothetical protein